MREEAEEGAPLARQLVWWGRRLRLLLGNSMLLLLLLAMPPLPAFATRMRRALGSRSAAGLRSSTAAGNVQPAAAAAPCGMLEARISIPWKLSAALTCTHYLGKITKALVVRYWAAVAIFTVVTCIDGLFTRHSHV
jgi:hypothetical protein